ncbi:excinuclease ABC subunit B [Campylobacter sputorum subsp. bubulus]|uniref:UvrABC system protein B n=1 Tax=Campylobacter sputorum subsp. sputorum TaxID=32024 RepID=A0A381DIH9_9BACT|nr:excinuclease ABC subunit UvrB [Campylobacter sputorum]ASM35525.1 UvrABC nucleotide excision repair complex, subunit UvrB [Campylobacter sputorum aubsp. sputorum RM3237]KAB0582741.1 excinuclease ABC subunit UvrB [Campylobacter sputorum subsp. sputorum]QEL05717.1 UvrABC nucleotide excision repair complex, subunit UvrB [Campylobacter sputorum subsp. sputorum]SUX08242.1 excinuclease ABC subunit B [Campylobacter sputorum subsp. bubulus]SUX10486.1 excinuclease ABC subunit B [Campylobacter sputoru
MKNFEIYSKFSPNKDQQNAIDGIVKSIKAGNKFQTLLGVTGSGKTFSMANIIKNLDMPALIMTHNKSLAAQLYSEFKGFFPKNHVEYFISYYDYYQPEAYIPRSDLFIEKDSSVNEELERLRLSATASLLSYDDVITIASVSANYGLGNPKEYQGMVMYFELGKSLSQKKLLLKLVEMGYKRNDTYFDRGDFRVNGDTIDIYPAYHNDEALRLEFFGDELDYMYHFDVLENKKTKEVKKFILYPTSQFIVGMDRLKEAIKGIEAELEDRLEYFQKEGKVVEYARLKQRVEFDLEMLSSTGSTKGVENYARYLTGQKPGETPYTLFDYYEINFDDYLVIIDESHVSLPQFRGMYAGDRSRKETLVEYGFRLPSALDNRPLKFDEFISKKAKFLFVSATPNEYELELSGKNVFHQIMRPTGLLDPKITLKDSDNQVEILYDMAKEVIQRGDRILVTVLTKKMAEELTKYYLELGLKVKYMHSDIDAIERNELIRGLRSGNYDMLIGINLLREGLDLPEVSLIAIMDADKEGFLRSTTSLIQTIGRAARNLNGEVVMFCKKITKSMKEAIDTTEKRRKLQDEYNKANNITPKSATRNIEESLKIEDGAEIYRVSKNSEKMPASQRAKIVKELRKQMMEAASRLEFEKAAALRDEIAKLRKI